jgi:hypothetical protein
MRTELLRGVHLPRPSRWGGKPRRWDKRCWRARLWGLLASGTVGFAGEPRKRLGISGALVKRCGGLAGGRAGGRSISCPPLVHEDTQPQEAYQQQVLEKEVVYHGVALLFGGNDDRLRDF